MAGINIKEIKKILLGKSQITEKLKYSIIIYSVALVHFFLTIIFGYFKVYPLFIFNIISVTIYLSSSLLIRNERLFPIYWITYLEIILHSFVTTLLIGWRFGFAEYIIGLIPVGYYVCYTMNTNRRKIVIATCSSLFATISFVSCRLLSYNAAPAYETNMLSFEVGMYLFNSICTFIFVIAFSLLFLYEMTLYRIRLVHQNEILEKLASIDPLTGLYNRRSMDVFLNQALKSDSGFSLIMCDIDNFKKINDTYGHDFGDVVLKGIAQIVTQQVNSIGYVCRWGGEEILILINNSSNEYAKNIAENIRRNVATHLFEMNDLGIHCTLTLGIAAYQDGDTIEDTITNADYNLYQGKKSGKNRVVA